MQRFRSVWPVAAFAAGMAALAYGGYGAGVVHATSGAPLDWLQVAAVIAGGAALVVASLWTFRRQHVAQPTSFAAEIALHERLVPTIRKHPEGVSALQELLDIVFEAHVRPANAKAGEVLLERRPKGDRDHA
jgi:hypothetical protein